MMSDTQNSLLKQYYESNLNKIKFIILKFFNVSLRHMIPIYKYNTKYTRLSRHTFRCKYAYLAPTTYYTTCYY